MFIYLIVNHVTGKYYVGQHKSNNLKKYLQSKLSDAFKHRGGRSHLFASMRKHPKDIWSIHPLLSGIQTRSELDQFERDFISFLRSRDPDYGYNICRGGEGFSGPHSAETRKKLSDRFRGRVVSEDWKQKIKAALSTEEWKHNARVTRTGQKRPPEAITNMRLAQQAISHPELIPRPVIEMSGKVVNRITVIENAGFNKHGLAMWSCKCHCGKSFKAGGVPLRNGHTKSCGCLKVKALLKGQNIKDMAGSIINEVEVLERVGTTKSGNAKWRCRCKCGNEFVTNGAYLRNGHTRSCGCLAL